MFTYLACAVAALAFISCGEKEPGGNPGGGSSDFSVNPTTLEIGKDGGECGFDVIGPEKIYVVGTFSWCSFTKTSTGTNSAHIAITVDKNTTYQQRIAEFSIVCGSNKGTVTLTQEASKEPTPEKPTTLLQGPDLPSNTATAVSNMLKLGWNLGNQFDAYQNDKAFETAWGQPKCTQATFTKLKSYGFTSVRIPITWFGNFGEGPDYIIDKEYLDRIEQVVGYAKTAGLKCIINMHHDENHKNHGDYDSAHWQDIATASVNSAVNESIKAEIAALWGQIAERFKNYDDFLIFEGFNEINDGGWGWSDAFKANPTKQTNILNEWNQVFVDAVRATGSNNSNRWLCFPGYCAAVSYAIQYLTLPTDTADNRLIVAVHCYDPSDFCTAEKYNEWGHTAAAGQAPSSDEITLLNTMKSLYDTFISKDIPCYFGEFGCASRKTDRGTMFQKYYLEFFVKAAKTYGLSCFIWDNGNLDPNGEHFTYVNHGTGEYQGSGATVIPAMATSMNSDSYTLEDLYNGSPR